MRGVIVANGIIQDNHEIRAAIQSADILIAANGGALHCMALGFYPTVVVGDFDSLSTEQKLGLQAKGVELSVHPRMKDQTDLELALDYTINTGAQDILLLGVMGGRLDQTIANLLLITRPDWSTAKITLIDGLDFAHLIRTGDAISIHGEIGEIVSLIPLTDKVIGVTTKGLLWSLNNSQLELGSTLGVSNELSTPSASIQLKKGHLLVVHRRNHVLD